MQFCFYPPSYLEHTTPNLHPSAAKRKNLLEGRILRADLTLGGQRHTCPTRFHYSTVMVTECSLSLTEYFQQGLNTEADVFYTLWRFVWC